MNRRKRSLPEDSKTDETYSSTDALCRAVKRLHTYSGHTSSCTSASKDQGRIECDQEASSSYTAAIPRLWMSTDLSKQCNYEADDSIKDKDQRNLPEVTVDEQPVMRNCLRDIPEPNSITPPQNSSRTGQLTQGDTVSILPLPLQLQSSTLTEVAKTPHGLASISVAENARDFCQGNSVPEPGTPGREETISPSAKKGYRLGTRNEIASTQAYDEMYEQANNLLKNLHFEWLHRKGHV